MLMDTISVPCRGSVEQIRRNSGSLDIERRTHTPNFASATSPDFLLASLQRDITETVKVAFYSVFLAPFEVCDLSLYSRNADLALFISITRVQRAEQRFRLMGDLKHTMT